MSGREPISVYQLNHRVSELLASDPFLSYVSVRGELSGFKTYPSAMYFSLKDEQASVSCVMFARDAARLRFRPVDGTRVVVTARAKIYERDGRFQLYVSDMLAAGVGDLYLAFERLKQRLAGEGLFDDAHKKPLPVLPRRIGVVTSPAGAVIRDIINVLGRRFPNFSLQLVPVPVQGEGAAEKIAAAIRLLNARGEVDVIIVGRGGGSIEDLWAFNEEAVARAIYESHIPVISAVGHETDFTISDFVADRRAPTPSAAAELIVPVRAELDDALCRQRSRLVQALRNRASLAGERLARLTHNRVFREPYQLVERRQTELDRMRERQQAAALRRIADARNRLTYLTGKLDSMSPLKVLARGYGLVIDPASGRPLTSVWSVQPGDPISVSLSDGDLDCTVRQATPRRDEHEG